MLLVCIADAKSRHVDVDAVHLEAERLLHMEADRVLYALCHAVNACAIFNDDINININILAVVIHGYAA